MEAKDTVMSDEQLEESIRKDYKDFKVRDETGYSQDILIWTREAQAKISFKAGIKYVLSRAVQDGWLSTVNGMHGIHIPDELYSELKKEGT